MHNDELKTAAAEVSRALRSARAASNRELPKELRDRFIAIRAELFRRGVFNPILVRFDSATVPQATPQQIAEEMHLVAENL
jgi:hypothetical protein